MPLPEVRRLLAADPAGGLVSAEVVRRRELYGRNVLERAHDSGRWGILLAQFKSSLVLILLVAGIVTVGLGAFVDATVIFIALTINVIIGAFQEERAGRAFDKLASSQERRAVVLRDGERVNIPSAELVPGDTVLLEGGYFVPADLRIVVEKDLTVNEAALTGEWLAVAKSAAELSGDVPLAERTNMVYMGTLIESGYGTGIVVATGRATELGSIAEALGTVDESVTPLQRNIRVIARFLSYVVAASLVGILLLGLARGEPIGEMLLVAIAVAVATIPSGLPAAVTIVLAIGMEALLKRGGLVRNLLAAETLGATTVILTDKTGTLTEAHMKLAGLMSYQGLRDHKDHAEGDNRFLLELAVLASDAFIEEEEDAPRKLTVHGRPIEKAVVLAGLTVGLVPRELEKTNKRLDYLQFTSTRRFGASLHENPAKQTNRVILSGEPETLIDASVYVRLDGKRTKATEHEKKRLREALAEATGQGRRVIAVAYRDASLTVLPEEGPDARALLSNVVFAGLIAFEDPVRPDVHEAISEVEGAGAHVIMLTGDNPETARSIAAAVGITKPGDELVIVGADIDHWTDNELLARLERVRVIARAVPAHKLRIVQVLKAGGEVVAMTGDGINDAPALRAANIGVAVGSGTEVAKEASDLVLLNDSFSIIVAAIEEGRRVIDNLKKILTYLLSTSFSEVFVIAAALIGGAPLPLLPVQILWANIVEEGLMSFSFAFEGSDPKAMKRNPRSDQSRTVLTRDLRWLIVLVSTVTGVLLVGIYYWLLSLDTPLAELRTVMFIGLSLDAIFFTFSLKSLDTPIWRINLFSNWYLLVALLTSVALLFAALVIPPLSALLSLTPLSGFEIMVLFGLGLANLVTIEVMKYVFFEKAK